MEENLHKDNLEEFFKNSFNDENMIPSDDQWDEPSDACLDKESIESIKPAGLLSLPFPHLSFNLKWLAGNRCRVF